MPARIDDDPWMAAYRETYDRITAHPRFNRLVREVAVAECALPPRGLRWLQRNSRTYGLWMTRQADGSGGYMNPDICRRRARQLCAEIAVDLFPDNDLPREQQAKVWVAARDYAVRRVFHHG